MTGTTLPASAAIHAPAKGKPTPQSIARHLDPNVICKDEAKRALAFVVYQHHRTIAHHDNGGVALGESSVLLIGTTGCGKTLLCETLSRAI